MKSAAIQSQGSNTLGARLRHARGSHSQRAFADLLGVAVGTYQNYERDDRLPDSALLARLTEMGWNANWLLTGRGDERLDPTDTVLSGIASAHQKIADSQAGRASHPATHDLSTIALQLVAEVLDDRGGELPPAKRAELTLIVYELLQEGIPEAKVLRFARTASD